MLEVEDISETINFSSGSGYGHVAYYLSHSFYKASIQTDKNGKLDLSTTKILCPLENIQDEIKDVTRENEIKMWERASVSCKSVFTDAARQSYIIPWNNSRTYPSSLLKDILFELSDKTVKVPVLRYNNQEGKIKAVAHFKIRRDLIDNTQYDIQDVLINSLK